MAACRGGGIDITGANTHPPSPIPTTFIPTTQPVIPIATYFTQVNSSWCSFKDGDMIALQADTNKFVARCSGCIPGGVYPDSAFVHISQISGNPWAVWKVTNTGDGKLALQSDNGNYLARCNGCAPGAAYPDEAFVHVKDWHGAPYAQWTCIDGGNGKIALQSDTGKFLGRCNGCLGGGAYPDSAFVHVGTASNSPWALFTVTKIQQQGCSFNDGDSITLQADTGKYVARCNGCVPNGAYPDSAFVHVSQVSGNPWAVWKVTNTGNGKLALQADNGNYLARCNGCAPGAAYPNEAFVHVKDWHGAPYAQWTCVDNGNGKISLQSDSGEFLGRCNGCLGGGAYPDSAFVHVGTTSNSPWAQFNVDRLPAATPTPTPAPPSACTFTDGQIIGLQADTGKFLSRCNGCVTGGAYPDSAFLHVSQLSGNPWSNWKVYNTGTGKLAFQADTGKYLARCNGCAPGAAYPDEAFVHVNNWRAGAWAQFTCVDLGNGKIGLHSDTGKYMSRCNGCVKSSLPDSVTMHVSDPKQGAYAQWTVVKT
ncbi:cytochrome P450 [Thraustotheca clavata]|uniref:Cytochrome P450 n=1 Tax=Thraustotheca clavata TaxID=74557 RepID=A0A1V9YKT5_9STRA|nr:cytochrome P450 [Thraustotheca clavata]